jgi:carbonic anhydrase/acetyltransferase-like protein (isoleucine patch superfamily)
MPIVRPYQGKAPRLADGVWLADDAVVVGDVELGAFASLWYGVVVRGDVNLVRIGARTNVQDLTVVHVTSDTFPTRVGEDVTVGHRVVLHGCTVGDRVLVGIGAIVLDGAVIGEEAMIGAGALVPPGMVVPPRTLVLGTPARPKRALTDAEVAGLSASAARYVEYASRHRRAAQRPVGPSGGTELA